MTLSRRWSRLGLSFVIGLLTILSPLQSESCTRICGSLGLNSYGYQDADGDDHIWLIQRTSVSAYLPGNKFSLHFSGGYVGDSADDFGDSGRLRFRRGYVRYGKPMGGNSIRLGRFFLYRGVAVGVFDGVDIQHTFIGRLKASVFVGMMGPMSRKFEFENPSEAFSAGAELRFSSDRLPVLSKGSISLSYTYQTRNELKVRHRFGLAGIGKIGADWSVTSVLQMRTTQNPLRKFVIRARYNTGKTNFLIEGSVINPDFADFSWFSKLDTDPYGRVRLSVEHWMLDDIVAGGMDFSGLFAEGGYGYRLGPCIANRYGRIGYRLSLGEQAHADGPWIDVKIQPLKGLDTYARWSMVNYKWDAFDIKADDYTTVHIGARYTPQQFSVTFSAEYQVYRTSQFDQDRRAMVGLSWRFDSGGKI